MAAGEKSLRFMTFPPKLSILFALFKGLLFNLSCMVRGDYQVRVHDSATWLDNFYPDANNPDIGLRETSKCNGQPGK